MLVVSPAAAAAIEMLLASPAVPDDAGLRLALDEEQAQQHVGTAIAITLDSPDADDEVVPATSDHEVFVERRIAELVDDQVLDAEIGDRVVFTLVPQSTNGFHTT